MNIKSRGFLISLLCLVLVAVVAYAAYLGYRAFKVHRFNELGAASIEQANWTVARYWYQKALELDENNLEAISQLCFYANFYNDPNTVEWWKHYVTLDPEKQSLKLTYAEILMRHNHLEEAGKVLGGLTPEPDLKARYENAYSAYYIATGKLLEAEKHARSAIELNPEGDALKLNLLNLLLRLGNPESKDEVNSLLSDLTSKPENLAPVYRILLGYSTARGNWEESLKVARDLASLEDSRWDEKTAYLKLLIRFEPEKISDFLSQQEEPEPKLLEGICKVMIEANQAATALEWFKTLEPDSGLSYKMCLAELYVALGQWEDLIVTFENDQWQIFDYYRQAMLSRAYLAEGRDGASGRMWSQALKDVRETGVQELIRLATIVESWPEYEPRWLELLEDMLQNEVYTQWAYNKLQGYYFTNGATRELYRISQRIHKIRPDDGAILNNMVMEGLLLDENIALQLERAKALYDAHQDKPIPTSTYAFALLKNGKKQEAWDLVKTLDKRHLEIAEIAHYATVIAKATGHDQEASEYAEKAKSATLLPEEKALLD